MSLDSDVALLGTGVAPLVAASHLLAQGKSVLLLNPDRDFFLEDSELPLDPLMQGKLSIDRLTRCSPEHALAQLRPDFPGAIEFWSAHASTTHARRGHPGKEGYHDPTAPHVRQRGRIWISNSDRNPLWNWETLEDLYVETSDRGFHPQILEGLAAGRRFPGYSSKSDKFRGLFIPKLCDVDIVRYRNGLLEFIRERLPADQVVCGVNQLEWMPEGIRFHSQGTLKTAKLRDGMIVFWTPRLTPWVVNQAKKAEITPQYPKGVRIWEQWLLNSREAPDPNTIGMFGNMTVWADFEGLPALDSTNDRRLENAQPPHLSVLRYGPLVDLKQFNLPQGGLNWASTESFDSLSDLCHGFLKWDKFSIRALHARATFEWNSQSPWHLSKTAPLIYVVPECDGPLVDVVQVARSACNLFVAEEHESRV